ncbi:alpha/beta hydrolase [Sphingomonas sp. BN140010]|uniref:Alpha/beta hydrolase n=1 Tax=Sphingomonas arvum TaxID=2992113 RepID=A0ABT3JDS9_9SPHN|nr:alpha/beta hydrolase [Sphingomonas sp. BN140010]MCW3796915.1 alpha/beta hydrolase [Sphingomonas sp. BN140010]
MTDLAPPVDAPQHEPGPRPLPLFLDLVRRTGERDPALAAQALEGLRLYQLAPRDQPRPARPIMHQVADSSLRDCGGSGRPIVLIPSLINPPTILDLDPACSLANALASHGHVLLVDWGPSAHRPLSLVGHVRERLLPLLAGLDQPATLVGYCLGGTMALLAAREIAVRAVATLASPWDFGAYPPSARAALERLWRGAAPTAAVFGALPPEVLQAAFWSLDPDRVVAKFAHFASLDPFSAGARRFVALEDWANTGDPLPLLAAAELIDELFSSNRTGRSDSSSLTDVPTLHFTAANDRIVPAGTAAPGPCVAVPAGHVGMVVGRAAPAHLHDPLKHWLGQL